MEFPNRHFSSAPEDSASTITRLHSLQESNPNNYGRLIHGPHKNSTSVSNPLFLINSSHDTTGDKGAGKNERFDDAEYETASLPPSPEGNEVYDYVPQESHEARNDDEYDYESPYWAPADKKSELLSQFRKLRLRSAAQKDIE